MAKKKTEEQFNVCYIRMSEYYLKFYQTKYGGEPVVLPENHPLWMILQNQLCKNATLKLLTPHCYSSLAFNYDRDGVVFDIDIATPSPEDKEQFLCVRIPDIVYKHGTAISTSNNWQLSKAGAESFRKQIKVDFWMECLQFIRECKIRGAAMGEDVTIESALSDFMIQYDIPMEHFENMIKYNQRARKKLLVEIERKRDLSESKTGRLFYYT